MQRPPPAIIYTHERRRSLLRETVTAWTAAGIPITHVEEQSAPPATHANRRNAHAALCHALERHRRGAGVLMLEDDTIPTRHARAWLEHIEARAYPGPVTLYTPGARPRGAPPHLAPVMRGEARLTRGEIYRAPTPRGWWGAQAVWIPWATAKRLAADPRMTEASHGIGPWDLALRAHLIESGTPLFITAPSIVQHAAPPNLVASSRTRHAAASYDENVAAPTAHAIPKE